MNRIKDALFRIKASGLIVSVMRDLSAAKQLKTMHIGDPALVEDNFGELIRSVMRERFKALLRTTGSRSTSSVVRQQSDKKQRIENDAY